jgi:hypothetical protein
MQTNKGTAAMDIRDHAYRGASLGRMRGEFWSDWQADEGAKMDAPQWTPRGSTTGDQYKAGRCEWALRSGHELRFTPASHQTVYVRADGALYRTEWKLLDPTDHLLMHCAEIRKVAKGARPLRRTRLFSKVEALARAEVLR